MKDAPTPLRIAYTPTLGYARPETQVRREVEAALRALESVGHHVESVPFAIPDVVLEWVALMSSEDLGAIAPYLKDDSLLDPGYLPGLDMGRHTTPIDLGRVQRVRTQLLRSLEQLFSEYDLLATPTTATVAFGAEGPLPFAVDGRTVETPGGGIAFTYPFNFSGNPAVSLRAGFNDDGLPVGLQFVSPRLREDLLLQIAHQYEQARPWDKEWPAL